MGELSGSLLQTPRTRSGSCQLLSPPLYCYQLSGKLPPMRSDSLSTLYPPPTSLYPTLRATRMYDSSASASIRRIMHNPVTAGTCQNLLYHVMTIYGADSSHDNALRCPIKVISNYFLMYPVAHCSLRHIERV